MLTFFKDSQLKNSIRNSQKLWFVECSSFGILRTNCGATFRTQTHPVDWGDTVYRMTNNVKTPDGYAMESYNLWTTWTTRTTGNWISGVFVPNINR